MDEAKYREICNRKTIYSDTNGFFEEYIDNMTEIAGEDWIMKNFNDNTDEDKIKKCFQNKDLSTALESTLGNVQEVFRGKSESIAVQRFNEARNCNFAGNLRRSLILYNQAFVRAPPHSEVYIDTLKARIIVAIKLKEYKDALNDIHLCLKEKLDTERKLIMYRKMLECYVGIEDFVRAKLTMHVLLQLSNDEDEKNKLKEKLSSMPEKFKKKGQLAIEGDLDDTFLFKGDHKPKVSKLIQVESSEAHGRYMTAKENISTGETLVVEEPYASGLLPCKFGTNCHHCMKRLPSTLVPCDQCSTVIFCSVDCQKSALTTYHRYECKFINLIIGSGISILSTTALRIITQNSVEYFENFEHPNHPFYKVFNLEGHFKVRSTKDYFHRALTCLFLLSIIKKSGYFETKENVTFHEEKTTDGLKKDELLIARVLLRSLQVLQFNAHEVYETLFKKKNHFPDAKINYIGVGIYPTVALFNHDCYPAVTRYFNGKNIIIKSLRPLKPKDVLGENYGLVFSRKKLTERQKVLSARYWFQCRCNACQEDWPLMEALESYPIKIKCSNLNCGKIVTQIKKLEENKKNENKRCNSCEQITNLTQVKSQIIKLNEMFYRGIEQMNSNCFREAVESFKTYSDQMHTICLPPYKLLSLCHEALRNCWSLGGNKWIIPEDFNLDNIIKYK